MRATPTNAFTFTLVLAALSACPVTPSSDGGTGGGRGGGTGGGSGGADFTITDLDATARETTYLAMAVDPTAERVGVAYFTPRGTMTMTGTPDYDLKYVEWNQGVVTPPQTVRFVQRKVGLSLQFHPTTREPWIAFLGGDDAFIPGMSIFWFQSDAVIARRSGTTWTETAIATDGDQVTCGNLVSDRGFLVGLWPALLFDAAGNTVLAYRDGHNGQNSVQDWNGSDVEVWQGMPGAMTGRCAVAGGNGGTADGKPSWGGHITMVNGPGGQPLMAWDRALNAADTPGVDVYVQQRRSDGSWTAPATVVATTNAQLGPSLAFDGVFGAGLAVSEAALDSQLFFTSSPDGVTWTTAEVVVGLGTSGWYPSLAFDPVNHEPAIAYYQCSTRDGIAEGNCSTESDELRLTQRVDGQWSDRLVDAEGGYGPKLGFFASGKRFVVYRQPAAIDPSTQQPVPNVGALKLAVER